MKRRCALKRSGSWTRFTRIGGVETPEVRETLPMPEPLRCRNKAEYAVSGGKIGFMRAGSREVIPVRRLPFASGRRARACSHASRTWTCAVCVER